MASFDHVVVISKTVQKYVLDNYSNHLKFSPRLIYRGSDEEYFSKNYTAETSYIDKFFDKFPKLTNKKILSFPGRLSSWKGQVFY